MKQAKLGLIPVSSFVVANMIGTGVFTTLGYQLLDIQNPVAVLLLWVIGGVLALCGALVYGELGAAMPRSGGEYHYLSKIYHPSVGFLSGWVSLTVGFAAPIALACMALGNYMHKVNGVLSPMWTAMVILTLVTLMHSFTIQLGGKLQTVFTAFKVILILVFILAGFFITPQLQNLAPAVQSFSWSDLTKPSFAVALVYVTYAYSGWNAAAYIAGDIDQPQRILPRSLLLSTLLVTALYFLLNLVFMLTATIPQLAGQVEVGYISAANIFGEQGGKIMGVFISLLLISTISSMVFVGPRVSQTMGEDISILKVLSKKSANGIPLAALWLQYFIGIILIYTSSFDQVLTYAGFTLNLFTFLAVLGVFVYRKKEPGIERPYKTWGYPVVPLIYLILVSWILVYLMLNRTSESVWGFLTVLSGLVIYFLNFIFVKKKL